ncbi:MAG: hypothetical protein ACPGGK_08720 [Pikeienuella sp.]
MSQSSYSVAILNPVTRQMDHVSGRIEFRGRPIWMTTDIPEQRTMFDTLQEASLAVLDIVKLDPTANVACVSDGSDFRSVFKNYDGVVNRRFPSIARFE